MASSLHGYELNSRKRRFIQQVSVKDKNLFRVLQCVMKKFIDNDENDGRCFFYSLAACLNNCSSRTA